MYALQEGEHSDEQASGGENGGLMKRVYLSALTVILFSATLVSFSYAGAGCCDAGAGGCCSTPNISGGPQQPRASTTAPSQPKLATVKTPVAQINPMPWSAAVNQSGNLQRLLPSVSTGVPGTGCCPGTNTTNGCCGSEPQSALHPLMDASAITEIFAFNPFLGTLW